MHLWWLLLLSLLLKESVGFWDTGITTTLGPAEGDRIPRQAFFQWEKTEIVVLRLYFWYWDWEDLLRKRSLCRTAGISIRKKCLSVGTLLNKRVVLTAANFLEPYIHEMREVRVWALGRGGTHITPYRYRVWRWRRLLPKSLNREHQHGQFGTHVPRHDVAVVFTMDQIYLYPWYPKRHLLAYRAKLCPKYYTFLNDENILIHGSGFETAKHVKENYQITYGLLYRKNIRNCETYLPKYWGKYICVINHKPWYGIQNGAGMYTYGYLIGLGCFEIRYNEDRIFAFTDLRYYHDWIYILANYTPGAYYEYAYPQWGVNMDTIFDGRFNNPNIPARQVQFDIWPLGK